MKELEQSLNEFERRGRVFLPLCSFYGTILRIFVGKIKIESMEKTIQDKAYFLSFCIEQYKNAKGLTGEEAMLELSRYGVLEYLQEFFDVLHTQSRQWLLADMDDFINKRKKERE